MTPHTRIRRTVQITAALTIALFTLYALSLVAAGIPLGAPLALAAAAVLFAIVVLLARRGR